VENIIQSTGLLFSSEFIVKNNNMLFNIIKYYSKEIIHLYSLNHSLWKQIKIHYTSCLIFIENNWNLQLKYIIIYLVHC